MTYFIIWIVEALIMGFVCDRIVNGKGYPRNINHGFIWGFLLNLIWALLTIGFSYYFINIGFGASGLALAVLLAYVIHTVNSFVYLKHSINHTK